MATRKIIQIDRDLCNGCGLCTTACDEGALALDDEGKAVLVREIYCDGMGMCLNVCPTGALTIIERESDAYDVEATRQHVLETRGPEAVAAVHTDAEPVPLGPPPEPPAECVPPPAVSGTGAASELTQWPIQLRLISPQAPYFREADLLIAADCTAFALGDFHKLLKDHKLVIACPKLDDPEGYVEKLADLIRINRPKSLTVAIMTVPCCRGLQKMVETAIEYSRMDVPLQKVIIGIDGQIVEQ